MSSRRVRATMRPVPPARSADPAVSPVDFRALADRTAGAKEQREYDTADLLAAVPAAGDRSGFLSKVLRIA